MSFLDTILIDDTDFRAIDYVRVVGQMDVFAPFEHRGDDDVYPGADGEDLADDLPLAKYVIHIPLRIMGATRGERNDNLRALGLLVGGYSTRGLVTIKRRIATGSGSAYDEHHAPGRYITGLAMNKLSDVTGRVDLQYYQGQGYWLDADNTTKYYT